ncbi:MAG: transposase [Chloroflexota bacterium]|nr:transposase [Chloroflexota bacterium]
MQEWREAYRLRGVSLNYYDQANQLSAVKEVRPEYKDIHSQVLQDVLKRLDKARQAFYRRVKAGQTPGYPRFQGRNRYDSITYPQGGWKLDGDRLTLSKIGPLRLVLHRPLEGTVKTVSLKREGEHWYVCFSCAVAATPLPANAEAVGVDMGLNYFATLSNGEQFSNPRYLRKALAKLAVKQQALARKVKGSHRRDKAKQVVATVHRRIRNGRADFAHKLARQLVNRYDVIVFEDLQPANMVKLHSLALAISDVGWSQFQEFTRTKAASAGRVVEFVNPAYTSQTCSGCGTVKKKELAARWHSCPCGVELDRDVNTAINILRLGSSRRSSNAA